MTQCGWHVQLERIQCHSVNTPKRATNGWVPDATGVVASFFEELSLMRIILRQVPVADVAVTATSLTAGLKTGEAMAMGERPPLALISSPASARMAVAEAILNLGAADVIGRLDRIRLSANWMASSTHPGEGAALYEAVEAIGMQLCPDLGISIPVGKDSMSMKMKWIDPESKEAKEVTAPLSVVITAFAPVGFS